MKITTNKDEKLVKEIRAKLKENNGYCPCRTIRNNDTKCMCKEFREMIESKEAGTCHCGLYVIERDDEDDE